MKYCKNCGKELPDGGDICLNCGKMVEKDAKPEKKKKKWIIIVAVLLVIIIAASGGSDDSASEGKVKDDSSNTKNTEKVEKFTYEIDNQYSDSFTYYIEGFVKNNKAIDYSYVQIEFVCYDADGNNLGTAIDNTNNLLANQTWKFKAMFLGTDSTVDHCDYHEITSW